MAGEESALVEILDENQCIDIYKYMNYVGSPQAGAIATISGTARDFFEGKVLGELGCESTVKMAIKLFESTCTAAKSSWNIRSIAFVHRRGSVSVRETNIFVAVSAVHREDALNACRFLIVELKKSLPIWQKKVYPNGESWKVNMESFKRREETKLMGGGSGGGGEEGITVVEILEKSEAIEISKYMRHVRSPQAGGAVATMAGTTRDSFEGKTVLELRYEAYLKMATRLIESRCASARSSWNVRSIAVVHRLGSVPVGETSVFIAVSAVLWEDALGACRFLIDELKASVPIWKKEVYSDGEAWKENPEFFMKRQQ